MVKAGGGFERKKKTELGFGADEIGSLHGALFHGADTHFSEVFPLGLRQQQLSAPGRFTGFFTGTFKDKQTVYGNHRQDCPGRNTFHLM